MTKALAITALAITILMGTASPAAAWTWALNGTNDCGETWFILDNTTEPQPATVRQTSHPDLVPIGTEIPAREELQVGPFDGTEDITLTLAVDWPGDGNDRVRSTTVEGSESCEQTTTTTTSVPVDDIPDPDVEHITEIIDPVEEPEMIETTPDTTPETVPAEPELAETGTSTIALVAAGVTLIGLGLWLSRRA